jgi:hypothetical protein
MSTFTIKSVMPTGKNSPTYGTEFYVQFVESEQAFPLWFKNAPEVGTPIEGEINGSKFKKIKKEYTAPEKRSGETTSIGSEIAKRPPYKDNSDGMRQGMCINNAANYVNSLEFEKALTDSEWATTVFSYANALYRLGDLTKEPEGSDDVPTTVAGVFGPGAKVVK